MLDLSRVLAGPWCSQQLADLGADVVKVEMPENGDDTRHWGPPFVELNNKQTAAYFLAANRGKQSIALNLKSATDYQLLISLIKQADVFIQNYLPHVAKQLGVNFEAIKSYNDKIIYCEISGYGSHGSFAERPGYDALIQAEAGLMHITGEEHPVKVGVAITDLFTGLYATQAITAALFQRSSDGRATKIEISLFDTQFQMLANQAMNYLVSKQEPQRLGSAHPNIVPYQVFQTADSPFMLAVGNDKQFQMLCSVIELETLALDPRASTNALRVENRHWLVDSLQKEFIKYSRETILKLLSKVSVPCAALQNFNELFQSKIVEERTLIRKVKKNGQSMEMIAGPIILDGETCFNSKLPPGLDENRNEIIARWLPGNDQ